MSGLGVGKSRIPVICVVYLQTHSGAHSALRAACSVALSLL